MATFQQVIERAIREGKVKMGSVNQNMIEVAAETKKKAAFVKVSTTEELARGLLQRKRVAFIIHMDADELNAMDKQIDEEANGVLTLPQAIESDESA